MRSNLFCLAVFSFLLTAFSVPASPQDAYQKGKIQKTDPAAQSCSVMNGAAGYQIGNCGDFHDGQVVDYRANDNKVYIRREGGGKDYKCPITAELGSSTDQPLAYEKGTIEGYEVRYVVDQGVLGGRPRKATAYDLRGTDFIYEIALCGSLEAGKFTTGQVVEYRLDGARLNILHDNNKEWSCQLLAKERLAGAPPPAAASSNEASPAATPALTTAKLSITSAPDGADIEIDGSFSGNAPSDLTVPEGDHTITVKKSGYKDWERKLKVVAGSNVRLNAEMERSN